MESVIVVPKDFIQQLKESLIPELAESIKNDLKSNSVDEYLTREEVCTILKITKTTLWRWMKEKRIPYYGISNRIYFIRKEIDEILKKNKIN